MRISEMQTSSSKLSGQQQHSSSSSSSSYSSGVIVVVIVVLAVVLAVCHSLIGTTFKILIAQGGVIKTLIFGIPMILGITFTQVGFHRHVQ